MKKTITMILVALMMLSVAGIAFADTSRYDVTEPITITWWHAHEHQWTDTLQYMVDKFEAANPLIKIDPVYVGSYGELNTKFIAAVASGDVPALVTVKTIYLAGYGDAGLGEVLDPYIEAYNFPVADFGEGLVTSTSYQGEQIALPYLTSTRIMYYNKTAAEAEGITMPKTFDEMEAFLEKATIFNEDGSTKRYGTVFAGWDYTFYEHLFTNNGVEVIREDGTSDVNEDMSVYITSKIKEWIDKGYAYFAYGTAASSNMRQTFWDGKAFSVFHTSSLYDTYVENSDFEVGISWVPGGIDGTKFASRVSGSYIMIPEVASQRQKNAAWQFMTFMVSPEMNLYWADETGYFPSRQSVIALPEYEEYLERKPAMASVLEMSDWIIPNPEAPYYEACGKEWRDALASIFIEGAPVQETLDRVAETIEEIIEDY